MSQQTAAQFRATAGTQQALGATPQEALNALIALLPDDAATPIVIWPYNRGDPFFTDAQQARLQELKGRRDSLTEAEREEWERLVEASFDATIARTQTLPLVNRVIYTSPTLSQAGMRSKRRTFPCSIRAATAGTITSASTVKPARYRE